VRNFNILVDFEMYFFLSKRYEMIIEDVDLYMKDVNSRFMTTVYVNNNFLCSGIFCW